MKKVRYPNLDDYDLSCYEELKGDILYRINGGAQVENSNEGVANAQVGDTITRNDGTTVTLNAGDIKYAQNQLGSGGGGSSGGGVNASAGNETAIAGGDVSAGTGNPSGQGNAGSGGSQSSSGAGSPSSSSSSSQRSTSKEVFIDTRKGSELGEGWYENSVTNLIAKAKKRGEESSATEHGVDAKKNVGYSAVGKSATGETGLTRIRNSIEDNKGYKYNEGGNGFMCDNWVEEVINDAGFDSTKYLPAGNSRFECIQHIEEAKKTNSGFTTTVPTTDGAYVVFMGDGTFNSGARKGEHAHEHCALLLIDGGNMTVWDNSSGNTNGGVESTAVHALSETRLSAFTPYKSFYFREIQ